MPAQNGASFYIIKMADTESFAEETVSRDVYDDEP